MLAPGLDRCPQCGKKLRRKKNPDDWSLSDIFWISATVIGYVLIPILIAAAIGILCLFLIR